MTAPRTIVAREPAFPPGTDGDAAIPLLSFKVLDVAAEPFAAVPTLRFDLGIMSASDVAIRSLLLNTQIRIDAARRSYGASEQARLAELFGTSDRWGDTLRSLLWTHATVVVPPFQHETTVKLLVPCTYDFDVAASKYLDGLAGGDVPLELLFSGSMFYDDDSGRLQTARLSWEADARYRMPVRVWKELLDHYFPGAAWLRLDRSTFDRLYALKAAGSVTSWDAMVSQLLDAAGAPRSDR